MRADTFGRVFETVEVSCPSCGATNKVPKIHLRRPTRCKWCLQTYTPPALPEQPSGEPTPKLEPVSAVQAERPPREPEAPPPPALELDTCGSCGGTYIGRKELCPNCGKPTRVLPVDLPRPQPSVPERPPSRTQPARRIPGLVNFAAVGLVFSLFGLAGHLAAILQAVPRGAPLGEAIRSFEVPQIVDAVYFVVCAFMLIGCLLIFFRVKAGRILVLWTCLLFAIGVLVRVFFDIRTHVMSQPKVVEDAVAYALPIVAMFGRAALQAAFAFMLAIAMTHVGIRAVFYREPRHGPDRPAA